MAYFYKPYYKFHLKLLFKTYENAIEWVLNAGEKVDAGKQSRMVDMYFDSETDLAQFVKLAIELETVEYFSVLK